MPRRKLSPIQPSLDQMPSPEMRPPKKDEPASHAPHAREATRNTDLFVVDSSKEEVEIDAAIPGWPME